MRITIATEASREPGDDTPRLLAIVVKDAPLQDPKKPPLFRQIDLIFEKYTDVDRARDILQPSYSLWTLPETQFNSPKLRLGLGSFLPGNLSLKNIYDIVIDRLACEGVLTNLGATRLKANGILDKHEITIQM